jgi:hypothetical protein
MIKSIALVAVLFSTSALAGSRTHYAPVYRGTSTPMAYQVYRPAPPPPVNSYRWSCVMVRTYGGYYVCR